MRARCAAAAVAAILATSAVGALFVQVEVKQVPVARLLANLQGDLKSDPANPEREINLARLYGMAVRAALGHGPGNRTAAPGRQGAALGTDTRPI